MNPSTGRMYQLEQDELPEPGDVALTPEQAGRYAPLSEAERVALFDGETKKYAVDTDAADWLDNLFTYHAPKEGQTERYEALRAEFRALAYFIVESTPPSREQDLALEQLERAMFYSNAAIARNE